MRKLGLPIASVMGGLAFIAGCGGGERAAANADGRADEETLAPALASIDTIEALRLELRRTQLDVQSHLLVHLAHRVARARSTQTQEPADPCGQHYAGPRFEVSIAVTVSAYRSQCDVCRASSRRPARVRS